MWVEPLICGVVSIRIELNCWTPRGFGELGVEKNHSFGVRKKDAIVGISDAYINPSRIINRKAIDPRENNKVPYSLVHSDQ